MKTVKRRISAILMALALVIGMMPMTGSAVEAAVGVSIKTPVSDSVDEQIFEVNVSGEWDYEAYEGTSLIGAEVMQGGAVLKFQTSGVVRLKVYTSDGDGGYNLTEQQSLNIYRVPVYFQAGGTDVAAPDSVRLGLTINSEAEYIAPATVDVGNVVYYCSNNMQVLKYGVNTSFTFEYTAEPKADKSIPVYYVDQNNKQLYETVETLSYGETKEITAPVSYQVDEVAYTLVTQPSRTVSYDDVAAAYTFEYAETETAAKKPYEISVSFVNDDNDDLLYSIKMTVDVGGTARMELPELYTIGSAQYRLAENEAKVIEHPYESEADTTYTVRYILSGEQSYSVTINYVDGNNPSVVFSTVTTVIEAGSEPFIYELSSKPSFTAADGTNWLLVPDQGDSNGSGQIVHVYEADQTKRKTVYNVMYAQSEAPEDTGYAVVLRYIDVVSQTVLHSENKEVEPGESVAFAAPPATLEEGETTFQRLNGQEGEIVHNYNNAYQTSYAVYYMPEPEALADEEDPEPVINVITEEVTQYITDEEGNITANEDGTAAPQTVPVTTLENEDGTVIGQYDEEGTPVSIEDGNIVTIDEDEVPLSDGTDEDADGDADAETEIIDGEEIPLGNIDETGKSGLNVPLTVGIIIILILAAAGILVVRKKRA